MSRGASASFRDPQNAAVHVDGTWVRVADASSAAALDTLLASNVYQSLVSSGSLVAFEPAHAELTRAACANYQQATGRIAPEGARGFRVTTVDTISYPWEWPDSMLKSAAELTLDLRLELLAIGLDLKDASALNVQFAGIRPVFIDIGSIEQWRPNPSWNACRQFIEHFINPLAVGAAKRVTSADAWVLGRHRGLRSEVARELMPGRLRRRPSLYLLQASTRPVERNAPSETAFADQAGRHPDLALKATTSLTRRLRKHVDGLGETGHATTWHDYGTRAHYGSDDLDRKAAFAQEFIRARPGRERLVLDVGGNDGLTGSDLVRQVGARVVVMDADSGALDVLYRSLPGDLSGHLTPLLGDITSLTPACGLLGREFAAFTERIRPSAVICQAVLHHVVITQGTPMPLAIEALAQFGAPVQIEFADVPDEKVRTLIAQIPNWHGNYTLDELMRCLQARFRQVEQAGRTSPTRVVVNAWND